MKPDKLLKKYESNFKHLLPIVAAIQLKPDFRLDSFSQKYFVGERRFLFNSMALTDKFLVFGEYEKYSVLVPVESCGAFCLRTESAPIHGKDDWSFLQGFEKAGDTEPVFSVRIHPEYVNATWDCFQKSKLKPLIKWEVISRDIWQSERQAKLVATRAEEFKSGSQGNPLISRNLVAEYSEGDFSEFEIESEREVLFPQETQHRMGGLSLVSRHLDEVIERLPSGERLIYFADYRNSHSVIQIDFITNRRIALDVSWEGDLIYAQGDHSLGAIKTIRRENESMVFELISGEVFHTPPLLASTYKELELVLREKESEREAISGQGEISAPEVLPRYVSQAIGDIGRGEKPVVVVMAYRGALLAWSDRLALVTGGPLLMVDRTKGSNVFYYRDIVQLSVQACSPPSSIWILQVVTAAHPYVMARNWGQSRVAEQVNMLSSWGRFDGEKIAEVQELLSSYRLRSTPTSHSALNSTAKISIAQEILQLKSLFDQKIIDAQEFEKAKAKLLE
jgi:hypothetical protein